ncbi:MAG: cytochrome c, partial [Myxococcales bacterium]|nr:cytochrome c [Myxococcales bacterium]
AAVNVVSQAAYAEFLASGSGPPADCVSSTDVAACWGELLYTRNGCIGCHANDGERQQPGPNWKGLFGQERPLEGGGSVTADENYIREAIMQPQAAIVQGYSTLNMPPYNLSDDEVAAIIAYMQALDAQ